MPSRGRAARASGVMALSMATVSACRFIRNIVLARMLLPADFGVGATFALTLTFLELITELGPAKQLVQAKEGGQADWLAVAHSLLAVRGALIAIGIFASAGTIASWLQVPEATAAFQCLALAPLMRGFEHLDACWFQRDLKLLRLSLIEALPPLVSLLAAPLAAWWLKDYRAFLVVTLLSAGGRTLVSHAVAMRPYRWSIERSILMRFVSFGWPLIGNSFLLFLILHGERFLVASWFDLATLGAYSVALSLAFTPAMMTARLHGSVALPLFSKAKEDPIALRHAVASSSQLVCLAGGLLAMLFVLAGSWMIGGLYSEKYLIAQQVVPWIGALCAVRVARCTPSMLAIALGDTKIPLYSNLARAASFLGAASLLARGADIVWAPVLGFVGELTAYFTSLALLRVRHRAPVDESLRCFLGTAVVVGLALLIVDRSGGGVATSPLAAVLGGFAILIYAIASGNNLRDLLRTALAKPFGVQRG